ncbi:hypothetical protein D3C71_1719860 [compost metagenome]
MHLFELAPAAAYQITYPQMIGAEQYHHPENSTEQQPMLLCPKVQFLPERTLRRVDIQILQQLINLT